MSKRYTAKDLKYTLSTIIINSLHHMYELEKQIEKLNLKMDGTDNEEDLKKARIFTMVLTILNDSIHSGHSFAATIFDKPTIERYVKNQKVAFDSKLVNPCGCVDCQKRGYNVGNLSNDMDMDKDTTKSKECSSDIKADQQEN